MRDKAEQSARGVDVVAVWDRIYLTVPSVILITIYGLLILCGLLIWRIDGHATSTFISLIPLRHDIAIMFHEEHLFSFSASWVVQLLLTLLQVVFLRRWFANVKLAVIAGFATILNIGSSATAISFWIESWGLSVVLHVFVSLLLGIITALGPEMIFEAVSREVHRQLHTPITSYDDEHDQVDGFTIPKATAPTARAAQQRPDDRGERTEGRLPMREEYRNGQGESRYDVMRF